VRRWMLPLLAGAVIHLQMACAAAISRPPATHTLTDPPQPAHTPIPTGTPTPELTDTLLPTDTPEPTDTPT
jgi:hypothetical protein